MSDKMCDTKFDGIIFADTLQEFNTLRYAGRVIHILCRKGNMGFTFQDTHYNISSGDYVILPNAAFASGFSASDDFHGILMSLSETFVTSIGSSGCHENHHGILMSLSETFVTSIAIRSNYGIIGHLSLLRNPVMKLSGRDFSICEPALQYLRVRMEDEKHLFREELLGSLLTAHILDLYDIHARSRKEPQVSERITSLLRNFMELLYNGEYIRNRDLEYYASRLCITPHYLSETCKRISGEPASYWIERFTMQEITRLLRQKELPLTEIAERMNFSSVSYFSRYIRKRLGVCPTEYRNNLLRPTILSRSGAGIPSLPSKRP